MFHCKVLLRENASATWWIYVPHSIIVEYTYLTGLEAGINLANLAVLF